jgi:glycosyltransferase involved in cell wall biosynthesis
MITTTFKDDLKRQDQADALASVSNAPLEVADIMPCLNEADTLETCIVEAQQALRESNIRGEIIVADNGSTDGSPAIATRLGARLVTVEQKGYGHAVMPAIAPARGTFIIMGDSDASYDFREIPKFVEKLRQGYELVQGCRLAFAGGTMLPGAMPFTHRWLGNPLFSLLVRHMFWSPVPDVYCGLRGLSKVLYDRLDQHCTGIEFATEMIIKAGLFGAHIAEVPITLQMGSWPVPGYVLWIGSVTRTTGWSCLTTIGRRSNGYRLLLVMVCPCVSGKGT